MKDTHPRPGTCAACGSGNVTAHCPNPHCPWCRCKCGAVTGIVKGQPHAMGGQARDTPTG